VEQVIPSIALSAIL